MFVFLRKLFRPKHLSPLQQELVNLNRSIDSTDVNLSYLASKFWRDGGICCPDCGVPGFSDLVAKQERRHKRVAEIEAKLARDRR
jgi:hypothetical protein